MACLPKVEPEIIDLSISDSDSDCGGGDGCAHACTCEFDSKEGVLVKDDDDCVDVTSDFAAPTPPMGTSSEGGGPGGLPDISLYDEVHHLIRAVQQPGSSVTPSTRTSASTPSSAFDEVYALLHRLEEALMGFVATPVGAAKAAASLRLRLERQLAESIDSKRRAAEEKQGCLKKKRELELVLTTAIHINHLELLRAARENCVTMPNKLYLEAVERAANENGSFDREFQAVKQRHREVVNEEKQAAAHEVFLAAQLQVLASAVPLAQAQQGGNESVNDEQTNAELSSCIVGGVGQLCALLTDLSAQPPKRSTTAMAVLARELVLFWTLNRSVLPVAVRAAAASSFAETARALSLAVPIRQALLERVCGALDATQASGAG